MKVLVPRAVQARYKALWLAMKRMAMWMPMGIGKTITVLLTAEELLDRAEIRKILIVGTPRIVHSVWPREIKRWAEFRHITWEVFGGTDWRKKIRASDAVVHLVTYDMLASRERRDKDGNLIKRYPGVRDLFRTKKHPWPYEVLVLDESTKIKDHDTARFRAVKWISRRVTYVTELTGTPAPEGYLGLWSQVGILDGGERLHPKYADFKGEWFTENTYTHEIKIRKGAVDAISARIADICISPNIGEYAELPEVMHNFLWMPLDLKSRAVYEEARTRLRIDLSEGTVKIKNAAVLSGKLRQVSSGFLYTNKERSEWTWLHRAKMDALDAVIEEASGEPIVVAYHFKADLDRILKTYPQAQVLDTKSSQIEPFTRGEIPILLVHPASAAHGIDGLQEVCNTLVIYSLPWSLEQYLQLVARLQRTGQSRPVTVHYLLMEDTVDVQVLDALAEKRDVQDALLEYTQMDNHKRAA